MSYARIGCDGSDVYVYHGDGYVCHGCSIWPKPAIRRKGVLYSWSCETPAAMLAHLHEHRAAGECVPEYALERLAQDVAAGGYQGA